jgi:hypothetical protein
MHILRRRGRGGSCLISPNAPPLPCPRMRLQGNNQRDGATVLMDYEVPPPAKLAFTKVSVSSLVTEQLQYRPKEDCHWSFPGMCCCLPNRIGDTHTAGLRNCRRRGSRLASEAGRLAACVIPQKLDIEPPRPLADFKGSTITTPTFLSMASFLPCFVRLRVHCALYYWLAGARQGSDWR